MFVLKINTFLPFHPYRPFRPYHLMGHLLILAQVYQQSYI